MNPLLSHFDSTPELASLTRLLDGKRVVVLTGAGCSTASGIPDYRGPVTRAKARNPVQHRDFITHSEARAKYWARSTVGWPRFNAFQPNEAHHAIARLQHQRIATGLITQNVDRLHQRAGSHGAIELHGALAEVKCLDCGEQESRDSLQTRLLALNPLFASLPVELAPDGDAELPREVVEGFQIPACLACGGVLKPDVVFFGDNVPKARVEAAFAQVDAAQALLVVGSSLQVYSGYRFVLRARERGLPIAIVNLGETRGDEHATLRLDAAAGDVLPLLAQRLTPASSAKTLQEQVQSAPLTATTFIAK